MTKSTAEKLEWAYELSPTVARQVAQYVDVLKARIAALEARGGDPMKKPDDYFVAMAQRMQETLKQTSTKPSDPGWCHFVANHLRMEYDRGRSEVRDAIRAALDIPYGELETRRED